MGLFEPVWLGFNQEKALKKVEKVTNPKELTEIVKNARFLEVRKLASNKLTDQQHLKEIAIFMSNYYNTLYNQGYNYDYHQRLVLFRIGESCIRKIDSLDLLKEIYDKATDYNTSSYRDMVNIRDTAKTRARNIMQERMKNLNQNQIFSILMEKDNNYYGWWFSNYNIFNECKDTAFKLLNDEKLLLEFAETTKDYKYCIQAYQKINILSNDFSIIEVIDKAKGSNKQDLLQYVATNMRITKNEVETLSAKNELYILQKIADNKNCFACEKVGGHFFDKHCICTVCGEQKHIFENDTCKRCKGKITEHSFSYYDGVPGYGTTVSGTSRVVVYPDGTEDDSYTKH